MLQRLFITQGQLEARLSKKRTARIYDDNNDGAADANPLLQLRRDASSMVASYLEPIGIMTPVFLAFFNSTTGELVDDAIVHPEITRLTLDVATALAAQRHPTVMQMDWTTLMKGAKEELSDLRSGKTSLGGAGAPLAANQGATILSGDTATADEPTQRFWDNLGDYR